MPIEKRKKAGYTVTTAHDNTAVGDVTTGTKNTAVGRVTTGASNTPVGVF